MAFYPFLQVSFLVTLLMASLRFMTSGAPSEDEIFNLPGLNKTAKFRQFSGYLSVGNERYLHYWFVESQSNPKTSPLTVWLNGGPGCSSLLGLLTENGPFWIQEDGRTLKANPYSWNLISNMLYIESPAGVGFSYAKDGNTTTNDDDTAERNALAVQDFFKKFPEYLKNDLYITGESYGGVYVPMLTVLLAESVSPKYNLKGYAVGNGLTSYALQGDSLFYFGYYHGLLGTNQWNIILKVCCNGDANNCKFSTAADKSAECKTELEKAQAAMFSNILNPYNIYGPCKGSGNDYPRRIANSMHWLTRNRIQQFLKVSGNPPCVGGSPITSYLKQDSVRKALHIPSNVIPWTMCSDTLDYSPIYDETSRFYQRLFKARVRGILYNGDVDTACNFLGDEWFVDSLQRPLISDRKMWYYKDADNQTQVAGFVKTFDLITYVTVRGSGHMVPTDRPRPALEIFNNLIKNQTFATRI